MGKVEAIGDQVVVTNGLAVWTMTASAARWFGEQMIARANDIERKSKPTPTGLQHLEALNKLYGYRKPQNAGNQR